MIPPLHNCAISELFSFPSSGFRVSRRCTAYRHFVRFIVQTDTIRASAASKQFYEVFLAEVLFLANQFAQKKETPQKRDSESCFVTEVRHFIAVACFGPAGLNTPKLSFEHDTSPACTARCHLKQLLEREKQILVDTPQRREAHDTLERERTRTKGRS